VQRIPINALLNYSYGLEADCTLDARVVGLDPGLGIVHTDVCYRDSSVWSA
jgi:CRISPR/Cas system-associated endonuclease Cas1